MREGVKGGMRGGIRKGIKSSVSVIDVGGNLTDVYLTGYFDWGI